MKSEDEVIINFERGCNTATLTHTYKVTRAGHVYKLYGEDWVEITWAFKRPACVLILETFKGPKPRSDYECCHKDDDRSNNHIDNLYWGTRGNNIEDAWENGKRVRTLSLEERAQAREMYLTGNYSRNRLALHFNATLADICGATKDISFGQGYRFKGDI